VDCLPVFVYGTLKTNEVRAPKWPHNPLRIEQAIARGALFDLGPYPALADGDDSILGEAWFIAAEYLEKTLSILDQIECFGVDDVDLYVRRVIPVTLASGATQHAYAYFIADPATLKVAKRILPNKHGYCVWSNRQ
jgi:gamma-glutamylcyclotransferase (GGCT)/AIG2-like uncharacterized protein YtfP